MCRCSLVLAILMIASCSQALAAEKPAANNPATPAQIQKWLQDLASPDFKVRQQATQQLLAGGKSVLEHLETLPRNSDLEVHSRIEQVIAALRVKYPPVEIVLEAPENPIVIGITQKVDLKVWFVNHSKRPVVVCQPVDGSFRMKRDPAYGFQLHNPQGQLVKKNPLLGCGNVNPLRKDDFIRLAPGEKVDVFHRKAVSAPCT